jgi:hypothetical protein
MTGQQPPLGLADAWLLAALTERGGRPVSLRELVHDYDWLNRDVPTFDSLSYGLARLVGAGLATATGAGAALRLRPTPRALEIRRAIPGHPIPDIARSLGATDDPNEDRSRGPLCGLAPGDLATAVASHSAWVDRLGIPFVALARVIIRWQSRGRPRDIP